MGLGNVLPSVLAEEMTSPKIACPFCRHGLSKVTNARPAKTQGVSVRGDGFVRRRQCLACGKRYDTAEILIGKYKHQSSTTYHI